MGKRKRTEKPPKYAGSKAPCHRRAIATHVCLEEYAKYSPNQDSDEKLQNCGCRTRLQFAMSGEKRKVIARAEPLTKDETSERARQPSGHNRTSPTELGVRSSR